MKAWAGVEGQEQGYLPGDDTKLQEMSGLDRRAWSRYSSRVLSLFRRADDGRYYSKRGVEESQKAAAYVSEEWREKSSEAGKRSARLRAARKYGTHSEKQWHELLEAASWKCPRCGESEANLERDHVIPLYQGGSDRIENIQPLCPRCNSAKGPETTDYCSERRSRLGHPANQRLPFGSNDGSTKIQPIPTSASASALTPTSESSPTSPSLEDEAIADARRRRRALLAEVAWRVEETWAAHARWRAKFFEAENGHASTPPTLTKAIRRHIRAALVEHDRERLGADDRERWKLESPVRAAGMGLFLSTWHTGSHERNDVAKGGHRYLEPERAWKPLKGLDPVPGFAELYFRHRGAKR
jgi:5-methylcytosine-specific restriction endonuclease McrA